MTASIVNPKVPADTVRGFVEAAKFNAKSLANYGSAGVGTVFHLTGQLFNELQFDTPVECGRTLEGR
jgi:hypothetical protein